MTDIARKRTHTEFSKGNGKNQTVAKKGGKRLIGKEGVAASKTQVVDQHEQEIDASLKKADKLLNKSEHQKPREEPDNFEVEVQGHGPILSLFYLFEKKPAQLKTVIENLLDPKKAAGAAQRSEAEMKTELLKVCFLYFFQLMGVSGDDQNTLEILFRFLLAKNSNVGKQKELTKT